MPPRKHGHPASNSPDDPAAKRVREEIEERVQHMDREEACSFLDDLVKRWRLDRPAMAYDQQVLTAFQNFGIVPNSDLDIHDGGSYGLRALDDVIHKQEMEAFALYHKLRQHEVLPNDQVRLKKMVKVLEMLYYGKKIVLSSFQAKLAAHQYNKEIFDGENDLVLAEDLDARLGSWSLRFRYIDTETNPVQTLLLHLLDCAMEKQYRKYNGWCYEPITINGYNTHAWRPVCEIKDFVYGETQKELRWEQWCNLTSGGNNAKTVVEYLNSCNDFQFSTLKKNRNVFAFRNGIYLARQSKFVRFGVDPALADSIVACKFFDMEFEDYKDIDWRQIPTPHLDSIMSYQGFTPDVAEWMFILLGRLLYDISDMDGWQVIPFLRGAAGSGKSTITLKVAKNFYDAADVGVLSNNVERKFGLSAFYEKFIYVAPEIKSDLQLEQSEFQSMVSGEDIQVAVKHQKAFSVQWKPPGILAGNEQPSWGDNSGSLQRRMILFDFPRTVVSGDMRLHERLNEEMPGILQKCNRAYVEKATRAGGENIWTLLPQYFKQTRDVMAQDVNSVEAFLASAYVCKEEGTFCPFVDFKIALKEFEKQHGYSHTKYTADFFRGPFTKHGLEIVKDTREHGGRTLLREYVDGVHLLDTESAISF